MNDESTVDAVEVSKFAQLASNWWDPQGPLKTLHDINPCRLAWITQHQSLHGLRVLDVGCGGGILAESRAREGALVTGLDVEPDAIAAAHEHATSHGLSIDYVCQPLEHFESAAFDVVICMELLEHVSHPELLLEHLVRLVKEDHLIFLSTLNRTVKAYATAIVAAEYVLELLPRQTHDYQKFIRPSELAQQLRAQGCEVVGLSGMKYNPFTRAATLSPNVDVNYLMTARRLSSSAV